MPAPSNSAANLFVCSSRRHLYVAAGLAMASPLDSHLLVVDQPSDEADTTVAALRDSPGLFASTRVWARHRGRKQFRAELAACRQLLQELQPGRIFVGNDRKFQFQYLVRQARACGRSCRGIYMDDGTGTYESGIYLNFWRGFIDGTVVALAKRIVIGWWYDRKRYFGGSRWVDECCVQHPDLLPEPIRRSKHVSSLPAEVFRQPEHVQVLERCFLQARTDKDRWTSCDAVIVLPLSKHVPSGEAFRHFLANIRQVTSDCSMVGIKYHPREKKPYLPTQDSDVLIDQDIPAEILFSKCQLRRIVGDTSSALLSAQWLQTGADIVSLCPRADRHKPLARLLERAGIKIATYEV